MRSSKGLVRFACLSSATILMGVTVVGCGRDQTVMSWTSSPDEVDITVIGVPGTTIPVDTSIPDADSFLDGDAFLGDGGTVLDEAEGFVAGNSSEIGSDEIFTLEENRSKWLSSGIGDYEMSYTSTCGDSEYVANELTTVRVEDGAARMLSGPNPQPLLITIDEMFALVSDAVNEPAEFLTAEYGDFGNPTSIFIDYLLETSDDDICVDVTEFEAIRDN